MTKSEIIASLKAVTTLPGIYLWKDKDDNVIYVGKAKNLRKRMHQYFEGAINSYKTSRLVEQIYAYEVFVCNTNKEALLLEKSYIDKYNPEYNILLLDDRRYPYLKVQLFNSKLEISLSRKINKKNENNKLFYFGPFPIGYGSIQILKLLEREAFYEKGLKIKNKDPKFWQEKFNKIKSILSFKDNSYINEIMEKMLKEAEAQHFEIARDLKASWVFLNKLKEEQIIELKNIRNLDVFTYKTVENVIYITTLFYRSGLLINKDNQAISVDIDETETLEKFFNKYYEEKIKPDEILVEKKLINLNLNLDENLNIFCPKIGEKRKVIEIAKLNLEEFYSREHLLIKNKSEHIIKVLDKFKKIINLTSLKNIIIFDNSNFANFNPVGVAVVYTNGQKNKNLYRKFNHMDIYSRDADVEYMSETIKKYFESQDNKKDFDLVIVDGGLAQIHEAKKVLFDLKINIPIVGLVKDNYHRTRALIDTQENLIELDDKELLNFLASMQIEVDRFAKSHLRKRNRITTFEGSLQSIKGVGKNTEIKLLNTFKTYVNIFNASIEELEKVVSKN
ncbi:GIY-YIG nuclease family protein [Mycoplasmopsis caviae]|uniref:Excinuclease ABC subunit C n=1 Tax=Mycoplasmopsis caviae TaxID=55603 RepID=A0A3P8LAF1_9BACT|nr:GIY-YIG nuclease family protein [Mycoplasmopsis caviae]VDR41681.1 excinuclease ABC subunit C [Mycoplasmopsis caviae]